MKDGVMLVMTSRDRVIAAIERKPLDRVPKYDAFWEDTLAAFHQQGMPALKDPIVEVDGLQKPAGYAVVDFFGFDIDVMGLDLSMRLPIEVVSEDDESYVVRDRFGWTARKYKSQTSGLHFLEHVTQTRQDWDRLKNKMTLDPKDVSRIDTEGYFLHFSPYPSWPGSKQLYDAVRRRQTYLLYQAYGPFECTWRHHGFEASLMDLLLEPDWMAEMFEQVVTLTIDTIRHGIQLGLKPDGLMVVEDMGGAQTLLFSKEVYRRLLKPQHERLAAFLHEQGIHFIMHSCGRIDSLIPDLIEAGLDVLQGIQASTGMHVRTLKEQYGQDLSFFGNINEQAFYGSKADIEAELRDKVPFAMKGGGYIYHSDHSISPNARYANYRYAMRVLDEIGRYGS